MVFSAVHSPEVLLEISGTLYAGRDGHDQQDNDNHWPDLTQGIQNAVQTKYDRGDDSDHQDCRADTGWKSPLLGCRGISSSAHDDVAEITEHDRKPFKEGPDIFSAVMLKDICTVFQMEAVSVYGKGYICIDIDQRGRHDDQAESAAIGCFILHDFLHRCKTGSDVKGDTGSAESETFTNFLH